MIICVCNNISLKEIQACLDEGQTLEEIQSRLHLGEYCGKCLEYMLELMKDD
jgi:bacterioferritin-associated ferredoxin